MKWNVFGHFLPCRVALTWRREEQTTFRIIGLSRGLVQNPSFFPPCHKIGLVQTSKYWEKRVRIIWRGRKVQSISVLSDVDWLESPPFTASLSWGGGGGGPYGRVCSAPSRRLKSCSMTPPVANFTPADGPLMALLLLIPRRAWHSYKSYCGLLDTKKRPASIFFFFVKVSDALCG
jgi:hypothetical protein